MKILLTVLVVLQVSFLAMAQDTVKKKEVGLVFSNFDSFGVTYRTGTSKSMWRYSAFLLSGGNTKNEYINDNESKSTSFGTQLRFGKEFRKDITEKFQFRYGADIVGGYTTSTQRNTNVSTSEFSNYESKGYSVGMNLVIGTNYVLAENFIIGLEILPYIGYNSGTTERTSSDPNFSPEKSEYSGFNYGLSSSSVLLSLVYRW